MAERQQAAREGNYSVDRPLLPHERESEILIWECHGKFLLMDRKRQVQMEEPLVVQHVNNWVLDAS